MPLLRRVCVHVCACVWEGSVVLGQGHGDKIPALDLGLRNGLGPSPPMSQKFSTMSHEERSRERSTEALRWAGVPCRHLGMWVTRN